MTGMKNPLRTRQDLMQAAAAILQPLTGCMTPGKARIYVGKGSAHYSEDVAGMECWSRALWALVPMLMGKSPEAESLWPLWREGMIHGTDPEDGEYWGDLRDCDQRMVEMAVIGCGLCFVPEHFLEPLNDRERQHLYNWLNQINIYDMPKNNWRFFRILVNIGFRKNGLPVDEEKLRQDLDMMESHYTADGWYFDYPTKRDYYTLWGFHFYSLLYAAAMGQEDPERDARFRERAAMIAPRFACWFDREGRGLPYGRSLTYRFCQSSFWAAMAFAGVTCNELRPGQVKHLLLNNLRFWLNRPIFDRGGALTVGYGYPNLCAAEGYNAQGSPYWALKSFWVLALPEDHPFWKTEEEEYLPPERFCDRQVRLLLTRDPENRQAVAYTAGNHAWEHMHEDEKYEKFAYSTQFAFSVAKEDSALNRGAYDSMLALREEGRDLWNVRSGCEASELTENRVTFTWSPMNGVTIDTVIAPLGMWHVRKHVIRTERSLEAAEGAFSVPKDWAGARPCDRICSATEADEYHAAASGGKGTSAIYALKGYTGAEVIHTEPNTNLMEPRCVLPTLHSRLAPGEHTLLCAVFTDSGDHLPAEIPEEVRKLAESL
ncbi:MAG: DUF2264 domain-containing protein [Clostridia bacterium]|nr:DUF2264 domain-containing protein [Clostridia bacterium]